MNIKITKKLLPIILLIIVIIILLFIIMFSRNGFTTIMADIIPHNSPVKEMVQTILNEINSKYSSEYKLIDFDSFKTEQVNNLTVRYTVRVYVHDKRSVEGRQFVIVFTNTTVNDINELNVEHISISNAVNLPILMDMNYSTRSGIASTMNTELINVNGLEQTTLEMHPYKLDGNNACVKNITDYAVNYKPSNFNDEALMIKNKHAVSFSGIMPYDNPTVARQEKIDYEDPMSHLFRPAGFDGADGRVAH